MHRMPMADLYDRMGYYAIDCECAVWQEIVSARLE
jgi:hypothetical protein